MGLNETRCPRCFRTIAEHNWHNDPFDSLTGCPFYYDEVSGFLILQSDINSRLYKGLNHITVQQIKEIQDYYHAQEVALLLPIDYTVFSNIDNKTIIQKKHIDEIRSSIEKLLIALSISKSTFLSFDDSSTQRENPLQTDFITPIINKNVIDVRHVEDLRKSLGSPDWCQPYWINPTDSDSLISDQGIIDFETPISNQRGQTNKHLWTASIIRTIIPNDWLSTSYVTRSSGELDSGLEMFEHFVPGVYNFHEELQIYTRGYPLISISNNLKIFPTSQLKLFILTGWYIDDFLIWGNAIDYHTIDAHEDDHYHMVHCIDTIYTSLDNPDIIVKIRYDTLLGYIDNDFVRFSIISDVADRIDLLRNCYDDLLSAYPDAIKYYNGELGAKGFILSGVNLRCYQSRIISLDDSFDSNTNTYMNGILVNFYKNGQ